MASSGVTRRATFGFSRALFTPFKSFRSEDKLPRGGAGASNKLDWSRQYRVRPGGAGARVRSMESKIPEIVSVLDYGAKGDGTSFPGNLFKLIRSGVRLCDSGQPITANQDKLAMSGNGTADLFADTHQDSYSDGRRRIAGASDSKIAAMKLLNKGGVTATKGFMLRADWLILDLPMTGSA